MKKKANEDKKLKEEELKKKRELEQKHVQEREKKKKRQRRSLGQVKDRKSQGTHFLPQRSRQQRIGKNQGRNQEVGRFPEEDQRGCREES
jgi:hypothetical protein